MAFPRETLGEEERGGMPTSFSPSLLSRRFKQSRRKGRGWKGKQEGAGSRCKKSPTLLHPPPPPFSAQWRRDKRRGERRILTRTQTHTHMGELRPFSPLLLSPRNTTRLPRREAKKIIRTFAQYFAIFTFDVITTRVLNRRGSHGGFRGTLLRTLRIIFITFFPLAFPMHTSSGLTAWLRECVCVGWLPNSPSFSFHTPAEAPSTFERCTEAPSLPHSSSFQREAGRSVQKYKS